MLNWRKFILFIVFWIFKIVFLCIFLFDFSIYFLVLLLFHVLSNFTWIWKVKISSVIWSGNYWAEYVFTNSFSLVIFSFQIFKLWIYDIIISKFFRFKLIKVSANIVLHAFLWVSSANNISWTQNLVYILNMKIRSNYWFDILSIFNSMQKFICICRWTKSFFFLLKYGSSVKNIKFCQVFRVLFQL